MHKGKRGILFFIPPPFSLYSNQALYASIYYFACFPFPTLHPNSQYNLHKPSFLVIVLLLQISFPWLSSLSNSSQLSLLDSDENDQKRQFGSMESLIKQLRVRFLGQDSQEDPSGRRIPPQKSQSFKPEKKRAQNWFVRQFSSRMSHDRSNISDGEFETTIAAAAFAITTLEETDYLNKKRSSDISIRKMKSRKDDTPAGPSTRFPGQEVTTKKPELVEAGNQKLQEKATGTVPSIKKTATFSLGDEVGPESSKDKTGRPTFSFQKPVGNESLSANGKTETQADAWEKSQMAEIKKRFEKQWSTIQSWENEKKSKAKRRLDRKESALDLRRARATQAYQLEIERINKIAQGAKSVAEERRRNDESKTREKVRKYKSTGQLPVTCFCF